MKTTGLWVSVCCLAISVACGGANSATGGDAGTQSAAAPTMTGPLAFTPKRVLGSIQLNGGFNGHDNLSLSLDDVCSGLSDRSLDVQVFAAANGTLATGDYSVTGTGSKARVSLSDTTGGGFKTYSAISGTVTITTLNPDQITGNKGSFNVALGLPDGGTSALNGTFDSSYVCH